MKKFHFPRSARLIPLVALFILFHDPNSQAAESETSYDTSLQIFIFNIDFTIPKDCMTYTFLSGTLGLGGEYQYELNERWAIKDICEFHELKKQGSTVADNDFIKVEELMNAPLDLLPAGLDCIGVSSNEFFDYCDEAESQKWSYLKVRSSPEMSIVGHDISRLHIDNESCRLKDGEFYGEVTINGNIISCSSEEGYGFKILNIEKRDLNNDGVMDVLIRVGVLSKGSAKGGGVFVLTKKSVSSAYEIIEK